MTDPNQWETRVRAGASIKLAPCALELIQDLTRKMRGTLNLADATSGLASADSVHVVAQDHLMLEKSPRGFAVKIPRDIDRDIETDELRWT